MQSHMEVSKVPVTSGFIMAKKFQDGDTIEQNKDITKTSLGQSCERIHDFVESVFTEIKVNVVVDSAVILRDNYCKDAVTRNLRDNIATLDHVSLNRKMSRSVLSNLIDKRSKHAEENLSASELLGQKLQNNRDEHIKILQKSCSNASISPNYEDTSLSAERNIFSVLNINSLENKEQSVCNIDRGNTQANCTTLSQHSPWLVKYESLADTYSFLSSTDDITSDYEGSLPGLLSEEEDEFGEAIEPQRYQQLLKNKTIVQDDEDLPVITSPKKHRKSTESPGATVSKMDVGKYAKHNKNLDFMLVSEAEKLQRNNIPSNKKCRVNMTTTFDKPPIYNEKPMLKSPSLVSRKTSLKKSNDKKCIDEKDGSSISPKKSASGIANGCQKSKRTKEIQLEKYIKIQHKESGDGENMHSRDLKGIYILSKITPSLHYLHKTVNNDVPCKKSELPNNEKPVSPQKSKSILNKGDRSGCQNSDRHWLLPSNTDIRESPSSKRSFNQKVKETIASEILEVAKVTGKLQQTACPQNTKSSTSERITHKSGVKLENSFLKHTTQNSGNLENISKQGKEGKTFPNLMQEHNKPTTSAKLSSFQTEDELKNSPIVTEKKLQKCSAEERQITDKIMIKGKNNTDSSFDDRNESGEKRHNHCDNEAFDRRNDKQDYHNHKHRSTSDCDRGRNTSKGYRSDRGKERRYINSDKDRDYRMHKKSKTDWKYYENVKRTRKNDSDREHDKHSKDSDSDQDNQKYETYSDSDKESGKRSKNLNDDLHYRASISPNNDEMVIHGRVSEQKKGNRYDNVLRYQPHFVHGRLTLLKSEKSERLPVSKRQFKPKIINDYKHVKSNLWYRPFIDRNKRKHDREFRKGRQSFSSFIGNKVSHRKVIMDITFDGDVKDINGKADKKAGDNGTCETNMLMKTKVDEQEIQSYRSVVGTSTSKNKSDDCVAVESKSENSSLHSNLKRGDSQLMEATEFAIVSDKLLLEEKCDSFKKVGTELPMEKDNGRSVSSTSTMEDNTLISKVIKSQYKYATSNIFNNVIETTTSNTVKKSCSHTGDLLLKIKDNKHIFPENHDFISQNDISVNYKTCLSNQKPTNINIDSSDLLLHSTRSIESISPLTKDEQKTFEHTKQTEPKNDAYVEVKSTFDSTMYGKETSISEWKHKDNKQVNSKTSQSFRKNYEVGIKVDHIDTSTVIIESNTKNETVVNDEKKIKIISFTKKRKVELMDETCTITKTSKCLRQEGKETLSNISEQKYIERNKNEIEGTTRPNSFIGKQPSSVVSKAEEREGHYNYTSIKNKHSDSREKQTYNCTVKSKVVDISMERIDKCKKDESSKSTEFKSKSKTTNKGKFRLDSKTCKADEEVIDLTNENDDEKRSTNKKKIRADIKPKYGKRKREDKINDGKDDQTKSEPQRHHFVNDNTGYQRVKNFETEYSDFRNNRCFKSSYYEHPNDYNGRSSGMSDVPRTAYERCFHAVKYHAFNCLREFYSLYPTVFEVPLEEFRCKLQNGLWRNCDRYFYESDDTIYSYMGPQPRFCSEDTMIHCIAQTVEAPDIYTDVEIHSERHYYKQYREFDEMVGRVGYNIECYWCQVDFCNGQFIRALPVLEPIGQRYDTMYCQ